MFKYLPELYGSWVTNRTGILASYYGARFALATGQCVAEIKTPMGGHLQFPIWDREGFRQVCDIFADSNPWQKLAIEANPKIIVDLGANRGATTLYFKAKFPEARVIGVEMDADNCAHARRLFDVNKVPHEFLNIAVSDRDGTLTYQSHSSDTRHRLKELTEADTSYSYLISETSVESRRLDSLLDLCNVGFVDLIKIDIEGAEQFLLDTVDHWAKRVGMVLLEIHHNIDPVKARQTLENAGFQVHVGDAENRTEWWCRR